MSETTQPSGKQADQFVAMHQPAPSEGEFDHMLGRTGEQSAPGKFDHLLGDTDIYTSVEDAAVRQSKAENEATREALRQQGLFHAEVANRERAGLPPKWPTKS